MGVERRVFLGLVITGGGAWTVREWRRPPAASALPEFVAIAEFDDSGKLLRTGKVLSIRKTDAEWKKTLAVDRYMVTRRNDTEFAYTGEYWNFHNAGVYRCVCCRTALFDSRAKFDSGTGWPSFTQPIAFENVLEKSDSSFGVTRTAVACRRCDAHLGHVFDDGPPPAGKRFCMNSVALSFRASV